MTGGDIDDVRYEGYTEGYADAIETLRFTCLTMQDEADEARAECTHLYDQILVLKKQLDLSTFNDLE